jgi:hypothetical protein
LDFLSLVSNDDREKAIITGFWFFSNLGHFLIFLASNQGDQIGRIFACWAIVYSGQVFENYKSNPNCWAIFVPGTSYAYIWIRNWVGLHFG